MRIPKREDLLAFVEASFYAKHKKAIWIRYAHNVVIDVVEKEQAAPDFVNEFVEQAKKQLEERGQPLHDVLVFFIAIANRE